jgi:hypothetical protein
MLAVVVVVVVVVNVWRHRVAADARLLLNLCRVLRHSTHYRAAKLTRQAETKDSGLQRGEALVYLIKRLEDAADMRCMRGPTFCYNVPR